MKTVLRCALATALAASVSAPAVAGELRLTMANGRVTLVAHDVTVRQILAEWARVGQARIVNGEKLTGGPVTIELTDVPEARALDTVLRSAAGYVMAPRTPGAPGTSQYDRIMILATSRAPATPAGSPPADRRGADGCRRPRHRAGRPCRPGPQVVPSPSWPVRIAGIAGSRSARRWLVASMGSPVRCRMCRWHALRSRRPGSTRGSRRCGAATSTGSRMRRPTAIRGAAATRSGIRRSSTSRRWMPLPGRCSACTISRRSAARARVPRPSGHCRTSRGDGTSTACWWRRCARYAFGHSMVRALVGLCLSVGQDKLDSDAPVRLRDAGVRSSEFTVVPARGLTLAQVGYPPDAELAARAEQTRARRDIVASDPPVE